MSAMKYACIPRHHLNGCRLPRLSTACQIRACDALTIRNMPWRRCLALRRPVPGSKCACTMHAHRVSCRKTGVVHRYLDVRVHDAHAPVNARCCLRALQRVLPDLVHHLLQGVGSTEVLQALRRILHASLTTCSSTVMCVLSCQGSRQDLPLPLTSSVPLSGACWQHMNSDSPRRLPANQMTLHCAQSRYTCFGPWPRPPVLTQQSV